MSYKEPRIDKHWNKDHVLRLRPFLATGIVVFLMVVAVVLSLFKGCTDYGAAGKPDVYSPADALAADEGFVGKTNTLLAALLADHDDNVLAVDLATLNRRYPALDFALPYGEDHKPVIEAADLRLVGIHPERIKDERLRTFYYNSRLPQLLQQQHEHMGETYFRIKASTRGFDPKTGTRPLEIREVRVNPAMFKVALVKNPWTGTINGAQSCLFPEASTLYVAYGNSMLPLPVERQRAERTKPYTIDANRALIVTADRKPVDYYRHYHEVFDTANVERKPVVRFNLPASDGDHYFTLCATPGQLFCKGHDTQIWVYNSQSAPQRISFDANTTQTHKVPFVDGMKLVVYNAAKTRKLGEFTITADDPTRSLSRLIQTQTGDSRYNIAATQTDLFTQQMIRSLSQHLNNRTGVSSVDVTLDPLLSREFETEVSKYLRAVENKVKADRNGVGRHHLPASQTDFQYDISLTVMDLATGNVIAQPFYTTKFDNAELPDELRLTTRNVALSRRFLGSTFKPLLACAAVEADPDLLDLNLGSNCQHASGADDATFYGYKTRVWADKTSHWNNACGFTDFLRHSDDVYPVALAAWAFSGRGYKAGDTRLPLNVDDGLFKQDRHGRLVLKASKASADGAGAEATVEHYPFTAWLNHITGANLHSEERAYDRLFRHLPGLSTVKDEDDRSLGIEEVSPDVTDLHTEMLLQGGDFRTTLVPWVLGQGSNEWSALQIANAWARMLSGHAIEASYVTAPADAPQTPSLFEGDDVPGCLNVTGFRPRSANANRNTWAAFLDRLHDAQSASPTDTRSNTLIDMNNAVARLNTTVGRSGGKELLLFSKTGTPDGYSRYEVPLIGSNKRYFDIGLYTFGLMSAADFQRAKAGHVPHGVVCVVRITRTYLCKRCNARRDGKQCPACAEYDGISSTQARDFFSKNPERLHKFYDMTRKYY